MTDQELNEIMEYEKEKDMGIWAELKTVNDFEWYKKKLDVDAKYKHRHIGNPDKFPCKVKSAWDDDPNGPYFYTHSFIYLQEVICKSCGHKELVWPEVNE